VGIGGKGQGGGWGGGVENGVDGREVVDAKEDLIRGGGRGGMAWG